MGWLYKYPLPVGVKLSVRIRKCAYLFLIILCLGAFSIMSTPLSRQLDGGAIEDKQTTVLRETIAKAAGYYIDPERTKEHKLEKLVVTVAVNFGFVNHLQNFKCFLDRLGIKFLVLALDPHTHHYCTERGFLVYFLQHHSAGEGDIDEDVTEFRDPKYNQITRSKKHGVQVVLELGYDVLFSDTDVVWVRDPLPYLRFTNVDYAHSVSNQCPFEKFKYADPNNEGNTGFYFMRSTPASIEIMAEASKRFLQYPTYDDQHVFWRHLIRDLQYPFPLVKPLQEGCHDVATKDIDLFKELNNRNASTLVFTMCPLDECSFACGTLHNMEQQQLTTHPARSNITFVTIHANYLWAPQKVHYLKTRGLWLATPGNKTSSDTFKGTHHSGSPYYDDGKCLPFTAMEKHNFDIFPIPFADNSTIKVGNDRSVYLITNNTKCPFPNQNTFFAYGLSFDDTIPVSSYEFDRIPACTTGTVPPI